MKISAIASSVPSQQPVLVTCAIIGIVTFLLSSAGVLLGGALGSVVGKRAEMLGGLVLIGLDCKILTPLMHRYAIWRRAGSGRGRRRSGRAGLKGLEVGGIG